jgi:hypothetical protein
LHGREFTCRIACSADHTRPVSERTDTDHTERADTGRTNRAFDPDA